MSSTGMFGVGYASEIGIHFSKIKDRRPKLPKDCSRCSPLHIVPERIFAIEQEKFVTASLKCQKFRVGESIEVIYGRIKRKKAYEKMHELTVRINDL